jgi:hypothetical protein
MQSFDIYDEVEKAIDSETLRNLRTPFFNENSWTPTIVDKFVMVIKNSIKQVYPTIAVNHTVFQEDNDEREYKVNINVILEEINFNKNVDLSVGMIRSPKCPKELPFAIADQFKELIDLQIKKKKRNK